ncbi:MAG: hypothetical protein ACRDTD_13655 [Pseudonocardiaceae bacterium]
MGTTITIVLAAWSLLAILVALFVARMIRLRDRQRPDGTEPEGSAQGTSADGAEATRTPPGWQPRDKA